MDVGQKYRSGRPRWGGVETIETSRASGVDLLRSLIIVVTEKGGRWYVRSWSLDIFIYIYIYLYTLSYNMLYKHTLYFLMCI